MPAMPVPAGMRVEPTSPMSRTSSSVAGSCNHTETRSAARPCRAALATSASMVCRSKGAASLLATARMGSRSRADRPRNGVAPPMGRSIAQTLPSLEMPPPSILSARRIARKERDMTRLALAAMLVCAPAAARVVRVEIASREPVLGGRELGAAGAYERLAGRVYFALDPSNPHNRAIVDLDRAARSPSGAVEFSADLIVLRPKDAGRSNGSLIVDVPNRGGMLTGRNVISRETDVDLYYLRNGYTIAGVGWQFDVRPDRDLLHLQAPI